MKKFYFFSFVAGMLCLMAITTGCGNRDNGIPSSNTGGSGISIDIKGSDTLLQLVASMAESYLKENPDVEISVTGGGSGTGIAALLNGETDMANSSRDIKEKETRKAEEQGGSLHKYIIARDGLSIILNNDNSVDKLTIEQVSKIFSGSIKNWSELGVGAHEINLYGRQSTSGTYEFMMNEVIRLIVR